MKIAKHTDGSGKFRYFSFGNAFISRLGARAHARKLNGVEDSGKQRLYGDCEFYHFTYKSQIFWLNEDWGDSSQFDVVAQEGGLPELHELANHFESFKIDPFALVFWGVVLGGFLVGIYQAVC